MKRSLSVGFTALYWIALPISALGMVGLGWILSTPSGLQAADMVLPLWTAFAFSIALTGTIIWRLWVHGRARRLADERASRLAEAPNGDGD